MKKKGILVVKCSAEGKRNNSKVMSASAIAAAATSAAVLSPAAMALVDDRKSTEGTGLLFSLRNNLLGWILLGVFGLIWSLYTVYTLDLEEDEESELSL
ncbi:Photosystem II reaction center W protein, chloroplastic [Linum grandiflorum]